MRDAIGGTVNIVIIAVFMVLVSGYMAFNVSYVKAFKVKNRIIDLVEQYEGNCSPSDPSNVCTKKILSYMNDIGYNTRIAVNPGNFCATGKVCCNSDRGFCINEKIVEKGTGKSGGTQTDGDTRAYYQVLTQVTIDIPVIRNLMPHMSIFQVTGETKTIKKRT